MRSGYSKIRIIRALVKIFVLMLMFSTSVRQVTAQEATVALSPAFSETVWITTDRNIYLPGDEIHFSACILETDNYSRSELSKIVRVELLDNTGKSLERGAFYVEKGVAEGKVIIPSTVATGWYYIRSYTNWMRNTEAGIRNYLPIKIVDPNDLNKLNVGKDIQADSGEEGEDSINTTESADSGYDFTMEESGNSIIIEIENSTTLKLNLLVHRYYTWYDYIVNDVRDGGARFIVDKRRLPPGLFQFSLLDENHKFLYGSLYLHEVSYSGPSTISINSGPETGSPVEVEFNIDNNFGRKAIINTSVSRLEPFNRSRQYIPGVPGWHITNDIPLESKDSKRWLLENSYPKQVAESFFSSTADLPLDLQIDNDLSKSDRESSVKYLPETRSKVISGRVEDGDGNPVGGVNISATLLSDNSFYASTTYQSGNFYLHIPEHNNTEDIIISFTSIPENKLILTVSPEYESSTPALPVLEFSLSQEEILYIRELHINKQISSIYSMSETQSLRQDSTLAEPFVPILKYPDITTQVDEFIRLNNISEVIYEVVPFVLTRKSGEDFRFSFNSEPPMPSHYKPLVLLDGIPLLRYRDFLNLPTDRFVDIRQINSVYMQGDAIFGGIISFQSLNNDLGGLSLPEESILLNISMPLSSIIKVSEEAISAGGRRPDLGFTLFSESFSKEPRTISFMPNDNPGEYEITLSGFNESGQWIFLKKTISFGID